MTPVEHPSNAHYAEAPDPAVVAGEASALLKLHRCTVSVAESCSGGLIAKLLTDTPGSSGYFIAGIVAYANSAKNSFLSVPEALIDSHGAVSPEVAVAMAMGARQATGSDLALSTTGIAGPDGGSNEKPVGTVFLSLADNRGCETMELHLSGTREAIRTATAYHALAWLARYLSAGRPSRGNSP